MGVGGFPHLVRSVTTLRSEHSERVEGGSVASTVVNYQLRGNYGNRYESRRRAAPARSSARAGGMLRVANKAGSRHSSERVRA